MGGGRIYFVNNPLKADFIPEKRTILYLENKLFSGIILFLLASYSSRSYDYSDQNIINIHFLQPSHPLKLHIHGIEK